MYSTLSHIHCFKSDVANARVIFYIPSICFFIFWMIDASDAATPALLGRTPRLERQL